MMFVDAEARITIVPDDVSSASCRPHLLNGTSDSNIKCADVSVVDLFERGKRTVLRYVQ